MKPEHKTLLLQIVLFIVTIISATLSGTEWIYGNSILLAPKEWVTTEKLWGGLSYSLPFLGILTVHELGHYFMARYKKIKVSLPYYIPFWFSLPFNIGTIGAFIRIKSKELTNKQFFDIGVAGPLAGFVVAMLVIWYGFTHLPPINYIFEIHPDYAKYGNEYANHVYTGLKGMTYLGDNLIFRFFEYYVADPQLIPPKYEMMHYPYLLAGYWALFFTSLNLLPIGQLDGGHILYGLVGHRWHSFISKLVFLLFILYAGLGIVRPHMPLEQSLLVLGIYLLFLFTTLRSAISNTTNRWMVAVVLASAQFFLLYFFPHLEGYPSWLLFAFILGRFLGVDHPKVEEEKIGWGRKVLGWLSLVIFILCFSPQPLTSN
jgi:membrane-associated protease RseP (regulator of RpoE activity)